MNSNENLKHSKCEQDRVQNTPAEAPQIIASSETKSSMLEKAKTFCSHLLLPAEKPSSDATLINKIIYNIKRYAIVYGTAFILVVAIILIIVFAGADGRDYKKAMNLYNNGQYEEAASIFEDISDYENSSEMISACTYAQANELLTNKNYVEAIELFDSIPDYLDSKAKSASARKEIMYITYSDVINLLSNETWYFNGGSSNSVRSLVFSKTLATITTAFIDGNGKNISSVNEYEFSIDDSNISILLADGSELLIPYSSDGNVITLGNGEYFTAAQVDEAIQGCWKSSSITMLGGGHQSCISFKSGKATAESAAEAYGYYDGRYYYYGPYKGNYTITLGGFECEEHHIANEWFFVIYENEVKVMNYNKTAYSIKKLPGKNGYRF